MLSREILRDTILAAIVGLVLSIILWDRSAEMVENPCSEQLAEKTVKI